MATIRSIIGVTTSYAACKCSADRRVAENATRISSPRRMGEDTQHGSTGLSRNRQTPSGALVRSSRSPSAILGSGSKKTATYTTAPLKVCNCVNGAISPLLANIFLHTVLDEWFEYEAKLRLDGQAWLFRYADDALLVFANEKDARRVYEALPKRFVEYGLTFHPDKTRLIEFRRPDRGSNDDDPKGPRTFDLLGFTHFWGKSRSGKWVVKQKTARDRFRRTVARISAWCRQHRHDPLRVQQAALSRKLTGHYGYFGVRGNVASLARLRFLVIGVWCKWLRRRSQRTRLNWDRFATLLKRFPLPPARLPPHLKISKSVA
jgi:hypothetical protein